MKKLLAALLALALILGGVSAALAEAEPVSEEMPEEAAVYEGVWACGRATAELIWEEEGFRVLITWGGSAWEESVWEYACFYHEDDGTLVSMPFGLRTDYIYNEDGTVASADQKYDDGEAVFSLDAEGCLIWQDEKENAGDGMRFERAEAENPEAGEDPLSLWTADSPVKEMLVSYIDAITREGGEDYIPPKDRIAVFDFDGTLFCETDPNYFDYMLLVHRVLEDPDYKDKASDFEKVTALKIAYQNETGASFSGLEVDHGKCIASAFAGMTLEEFYGYVHEFKKLPMPSYEGMTRGGGFYLPMVQVVEYLQANDFIVYIISGTDRFIVRGIMNDNAPISIPPRQIIGSDETVVASKQGDNDGLSYMFNEDDVLQLGGNFIIKNLKMNKVSVIMQEIGQQPVLSFGNSTGDSSMAEYVTNNNPYASLAFMLCCDDLERENGNQKKADQMYGYCEAYGWIPVSMKDDWTTIYGDGVVKK